METRNLITILSPLFAEYADIEKKAKIRAEIGLTQLINSFTNFDFNRNVKINFCELNQCLTHFAKADISEKYQFITTLSEINIGLITFGKSLQDSIKVNEITSCNFNALRFFSINEQLHSKLLEKLLNPKAEHGQGNRFLVEFLKLLEIEKPNEGTWSVTAEMGRIDVLLKRLSPLSIIIIENKSNWAGDQQNQLYRYWFQEIFSKTNEKDAAFYDNNSNRYKIIYIPPNDYKQPEMNSLTRPNHESWVNANLPEVLPLKVEIKAFNDFIIQWLDNCISVLPEKNHRMREYLKQYIEICNNL